MASIPEITEELLVGRRALEEVPCLRILDDWEWHEASQKWVLHCHLTVDIPDGSLVQRESEWHILVDRNYPWGRIQFLPAKQNSITATFPHQLYNGPGSDTTDWRDGEICLDRPGYLLGRAGRDAEPRESSERLKWYCARAIQWISAAASDKLVQDGDHFELPQLPLQELTTVTVAFNESSVSFQKWADIQDKAGLVTLQGFKHSENILIVTEFLDANQAVLLKYDWNDIVSDDPIVGMWFRLDFVPVLAPWQAPCTWGELTQACRRHSTNPVQVVRPVLKHLRDNAEHIALVGFPLPRTFGGKPAIMHWQAMILPALSLGDEFADGFRKDEQGYFRRDQQVVFRARQKMEWVQSQNWHSDQIQSRGRLPVSLRGKSVTVIGVGAIGAPFAEILARAGVSDLTLLDPDNLEIGNLVRHTLGFEGIGQSKARLVAERISRASPHVCVTHYACRFPPADETAQKALRRSEIILDCTARDEVIAAMGEFDWQDQKVFASFSLGLNAQRLFCFTARSTDRFPAAAFFEHVRPWIENEREEGDVVDYPLEGIGCWHPVFPARIDDIWTMVGVACKELARFVESSSGNTHFTVFEQRFQNGDFVGIHRVEGA